MTTVSILRPWWETDVRERWRNRDFTKMWWQTHFPEWELIEGAPEGGGRAQGDNWCAGRASGDVFIRADVDCFCSPELIREAVAIASKTGVLVYPFDSFRELDEMSSTMVVHHAALPEEGTVALETPNGVGGMLVVTAEAWAEVGGFDEHFIGWGFEDAAFNYAALTLLGPEVRMGGVCWHLWHPPSPDFDLSCPTYQANRDRCHRYERAIGDAETMKELIR